MNPNVAHIIYASDDRYAEILGVSLVSLYENSKDMEDIILYIIDNNISKYNKKRLDDVCRIYKRTPIKWMPSKNINEILSINVKVDRCSLSQYSRIFISSLVPDKLDRILYLDCDVIVNKSIKELWNYDIHGKTVGALADAFSSLYRMNIDLKKEDIMFNSGVMLINLDLWKEKNIEAQLISYILKKKGRIQQGDQGVLNSVLSKQTYCLEPRFNSVTIFYDFNYSEMMIYRKPPRGFYNKTEIKKAVEDPTIIHFTTSFISKRPWIKGCKHKYVDKWIYYKSISPWNTYPLREDTSSRVKRKLLELANILPRMLVIRVYGLAQAYIRPLFYRVVL